MSESNPWAERRLHERRQLHTTAQALLPGNRVAEVRTLDISAGGMAIVATANPPAGTTFTIRVHLPLRPLGSTMFESLVQVTDSVYGTTEGGFRVGLRFIHLAPDAAAAIAAYLK